MTYRLFYAIALLLFAADRLLPPAEGGGGLVETIVGVTRSLLLPGSVLFTALGVMRHPEEKLPFGNRVGGIGAAAVLWGAIFLRLRIDAIPSLLTVLLTVPMIGAIVVLFMPRQWVNAIRRISTFFMLVELWLSTWLLEADYGGDGWQFAERADWIGAFGIRYQVGIDGISLWLVLLTTLLTPIALWVSWGSIDTKIKEYAFSFLLLEVGMLGAFFALDLFLFYVFWELMLVPMYLIIGIWGGKERIYAAVKFFLYTMVGSLLMLVAILYLATRYHELAVTAGVPEALRWSFSIDHLRHVVLTFDEQVWLFAAFALAFAIKVPMFPLHTWLPDAHVQAPTGGSVILAAVLLKLGGYGFLRFAMPLFPYAAHWVGPSLAVFAVIGILYGAACAWVQRDVKKLVAYSSVSHLGFVMLGLFSMTSGGVSGAVMQMVAHGISTGALFILVGVIYDRRHTRDLADFGGLAKVMPWYALVFVIITMSSVGLPGTNGFVGEFMILSGAFVSEQLSVWEKVFVLFAATGVILAAIYMLHAVLKMFWGPVKRKENEHLPDLNGREELALLPLVAAVFFMGFFPETMLSSIRPAVNRMIASYDARWNSDYHDDTPRLTPFSVSELRELGISTGEDEAESGGGGGEGAADADEARGAGAARSARAPEMRGPGALARAGGPEGGTL
jgi:NADH-quinone oxidoreductase subunit M